MLWLTSFSIRLLSSSLGGSGVLLILNIDCSDGKDGDAKFENIFEFELNIDINELLETYGTVSYVS